MFRCLFLLPPPLPPLLAYGPPSSQSLLCSLGVVSVILPPVVAPGVEIAVPVCSSSSNLDVEVARTGEVV